MLPVGEALPPLELRDLAGVASPICGPDGRGALVVFWSEDCLSCDELLDRLRTARFGERPASPALVLVTAGELAAPPLPRSPWPILRDPDFSASARLGIPGTPAALLLDRDCAPLAPPAIGAAAVAALAGLA